MTIFDDKSQPQGRAFNIKLRAFLAALALLVPIAAALAIAIPYKQSCERHGGDFSSDFAGADFDVSRTTCPLVNGITINFAENAIYLTAPDWERKIVLWPWH